MARVPSTNVINADNEFTRLQAMMGDKIKDMNTDNKGEVDNKNPHVMEDVMEELEQRNLEMASLLKASDKSRQSMEDSIKQNNKEITSLRANTLVMHTLQDNVHALHEMENDLRLKVSKLEDELNSSRVRDMELHHETKEREKKEEVRASEFNEKLRELAKNLLYAEDQVAERDAVIEKTEETLSDLFETCEQISNTNTSMKTEVDNCKTSNDGVHAKNETLQSCKEYLEEQVDAIVKDVKSTRGVNEKMKLEIANMVANNRNHTKTHTLLTEKVYMQKEDAKLIKDQVTEAKLVLTDYESGELKSNVVLGEIKKERIQNEATIKKLQANIQRLEDQIAATEEKVRKVGQTERKMESRIHELETKINNYQENYIDSQELETVKNDLHIKHRLDLNLQRTRVDAVLNKDDQLDLIKAIKESLAQKKDAKDMDEILSNFLA
jgi:chromosome segregation ATPase